MREAPATNIAPVPETALPSTIDKLVIRFPLVSNTLPPDGRWTLDPINFTLQCPNGSGVFDFEDPSQIMDVDFSADGSVLVAGPDRFTRSEPGVYAAQFSEVVDGVPLTMNVTVRIVSDNRMVVEGVSSFEGCNVIGRWEYYR